MTKKHEELAKICHHINKQNFLFNNIEVNRRNGYYAIDQYDRDDNKFIGYLFCGDWKECHTFLQGIKAAIYYCLPF